jgi:hypothetical protein
MMRDTLLAVKGDTFDVLSVRDEVEAIAGLFGEYLAQTTGGRGSKHRALGAVGKALQHARTVRGDSLLGYARRVHEQLVGSSYPAGAVERLDDGLRRLDALLSGAVPPRAATEILSRINYATYYDVRRRGMEFLTGWERIARQSAERLDLAAGSKLPRFSEARDGKLGNQWKELAEQYLTQTRTAPVADEEED